MKKDYSWVLYALILGICILASSCGDNRPTVVEQIKLNNIKQDSVYKHCFPYEWDRIVYNEREMCGKTDSGRFAVWYNEEYVDLNHMIFTGIWTDKHTFVSEFWTLSVTPYTLVIMYNDSPSNMCRYIRGK